MPQIVDLLRRSFGRALAKALRPAPQPDARRSAQRGTPRPPSVRGEYPGDFPGFPRLEYAPHSTPLPDPGEVAWGWVPYEEDHSQGKDRPVLIIGHDGGWLLGLPLSSVDHRRDRAQEASQGRYWVYVGSGNWDSKGRESEVRVDRIVRFDPDGMRRVAGELDRGRYDEVARGVQLYWNK